ncbi:hypothetical protein H5410_057021 [Solanum commersonii]|uniref:Uncharacterized protein n=1 Tax=Solanum commersonii TaxID=4109 RepID=A0A9J5WNX7_SOLCO|nr:hypothetical protein H5410_057021 [Solanum commersonii]
MARLITEERRVSRGACTLFQTFTDCSTFTSVTGCLETQGRTARRLCGSSMLPMLPLSGAPFLSGRSP